MADFVLPPIRPPSQAGPPAGEGGGQLLLEGLGPLRSPRTRIVLSFGGGMESTTVLLLLTRDERYRSKYPISLVVFADLGWEWPETYAHLEWSRRYAAGCGIEFATLTPRVERRPFLDYDDAGRPILGEKRVYTDLYTYQWESRTVPGKTPRGQRLCTDLFKIRTIRSYLSERFAGEDLVVLIGFGADEAHRAARGELAADGYRKAYPLIEADLCRCRSIEYLRACGVRVPRRSGCTFCPFQKRAEWEALQAIHPALFEKAALLEEHNRRFNDPEHPIHLASMSHPLREWLMRPTPDRAAQVCRVCGRAIDRAEHLWGDGAGEVLARRGEATSSEARR